MRQLADTVPEPTLLAWNAPLAEALGLSGLAESDVDLAELFGGNRRPDEAEPIALAYAGHQFGNFVPQLGDGRALLIGDVVATDGRRYDVQLKGSGRTPFSRGGDGKSAMGPVLREYVVSEAMHRLGVPTSRALAAVATGERVMRERLLPGAVMTRVAASHLRVGTFEYFAARRDLEALHALANFAIERHVPDCATSERPYVALFESTLAAQAKLVASWMGLGFIHGVMNTDNTAISGETIDYGPCAFMDEFQHDKVFSSIDRGGRYAYRMQPTIAQWNLARFAECLLLIDDAKERYEQALEQFIPSYRKAYYNVMCTKLGLRPDDGGQHDELISAWLQHLQDHQLDFTLSFRQLADRLDASSETDEPHFGRFEQRWREAIVTAGDDPAEVRTRMNAVNPLFIPRNHQIERAIDAATGGDMSIFNDLLEVTTEPYEEQPALASYAVPPAPRERVTATFCGT
ncbi:MAG: YdiU family protein [Thermoanaerobaculia bacterium]|nr:YdiU family protein [Thermoanaerobaculia bacterium]